MSWNDAQCDVCSRQWEIHLRMGCVHEHIGDVRFCGIHRGRIVGLLVCTPCINDHECTLSVVNLIEDRDPVSA